MFRIHTTGLLKAFIASIEWIPYYVSVSLFNTVFSWFNDSKVKRK